MDEWEEVFNGDFVNITVNVMTAVFVCMYSTHEFRDAKWITWKKIFINNITSQRFNLM